MRHRKESSVATEHMLQFVGTFGKLRKATVNFVVFFCFRLHGTSPLPLDGFLLNFICLSIFRKSRERIQVSLISDKSNWYFV